jgi:murein DD-endopeptidase MepM/ murein hydrolase activator NlpD
MNNLIKIANFLESIQMYKASDTFIRVAQFQPIRPSELSVRSQDTILTEDVNPISIWANPEYYSALKGLPGSGTYNVAPNILKTLDGVPARFKNMELDDVMKEINNIIPAYNPSVHGSFDNYRRFILSSILDNNERREFVEDAEKLMKVFRKYLAEQVIPDSISADPQINEEFKKGIEKILLPEDSSSPLYVALDLLRGGTPSAQSTTTSPPRGNLPNRSTNRGFSRGGGPGITSPFGPRNNPNAPGTTQFHQGIDKPARVGTPVKSALDGEVIFVGNSGNYGLLIKIQHAGNLESRYAHLSGANVSVGDTVRSGEVIGFSGQSGNATGPHLHFEIRSGGSPIDPTSYSSRVL